MKTIERTTFANVISDLVDLSELKQINLITIMRLFVYYQGPATVIQLGDPAWTSVGGKSNKL